ncbi:MAG: CoA-binding protein [Desulfobacteraceae bacterium A6]|nr:MAG: CoA-binding protein [Desulfobacteraceae bacterium A6]
MEFFFKPKGIALIGASSNPYKGGNSILKNLLKGFKGGIYPVNPAYNEIEGLKCYPSVTDVPDPVDLAIVFVPAKLVPDVIRECVQRKIPGVMIESGGFAEAGARGESLQSELKQICDETGIRLWGPNCMGLVDFVSKRVFSFVSPTLWNYEFIKGNVSLIVQSGMLSAGFIIDTMSHGVMGISKVCSIGNKVDVDECELLEYLLEDPETAVVGLYLESFSDGRRFVDICRRSGKPIVVLKGGKSAKGAAAAMSHTASLAGNSAVISGALAQAGVVEAVDFKQMLDLCRSLAMYPEIPRKVTGGVAILTYSGGAGIVSSDFIDKTTLSIAELSQSTKDALETIYPEWMPVANPIDLWPAIERGGSEKAYGEAIKAVCDDPNVDAVFLHYYAGGFALNFDISSIVEVARKSHKPMFCWLMGEAEKARKFQTNIQNLGVPVYRELYRAVECMAAVFERKKPEKRVLPSHGSDHAIPGEYKPELQNNGGVLDEHLSKKILAGYSIPVVDEKIAVSVEDTLDAARSFGFPVVMKGILPGEIHKTESGLVRLGVSSEEEIKKIFGELNIKMAGKGKILVQRQMEGGLELIAGMVRDPQFGPCVMLGLGGIFTEILKDTVFAVAPVSHGEALSMIERLKSQKLLNGFRGYPPVDREILAKIIVRLGDLGCGNPQIKEIDINPLIAGKNGIVAVDAVIVLC